MESLAKTIDMKVIEEGKGDAAHKHELTKLAALAGMKAEDLENPV